MAKVDPLLSAATAYAAERWSEDDWRQFGRDTGTSDILKNHPRLYRSISFGDPDYPDAAAEVLERVLREAIEPGSGEHGRMELLADSMPDLPNWIADHAPPRTRKLFTGYIAARAMTEIPDEWATSGYVVRESPAGPPNALSGSVPMDKESPSPTEGLQSGGTQWDEEQSTIFDPPRPAPPASTSSSEDRTGIFIVHGHDEAALNSIRIYVHELTGVVPISLAEQAGRGDTIIEKFERYGSTTAFVIVLLTPDDVGHTLAEHEAGSVPNPRARQNVVLELGYFIGRIGRENVVVIDADVERPSDLMGLSYVAYPKSNWKDDLRKELKAAGLTDTDRP